MSTAWFADRLRELREAKGLTQKQLAELAGVSLRGVAQWEQGVREPGWSSVVALCEALAVSCEAFRQEPTRKGETKPGRPRRPARETSQQAQPSGQPSPQGTTENKGGEEPDFPLPRKKRVRRKPPGSHGGPTHHSSP
jgi:transcriptional regulator with XRE-family HTH domain